MALQTEDTPNEKMKILLTQLASLYRNMVEIGEIDRNKYTKFVSITKEMTQKLLKYELDSIQSVKLWDSPCSSCYSNEVINKAKNHKPFFL